MELTGTRLNRTKGKNEYTLSLLKFEFNQHKHFVIHYLIDQVLVPHILSGQRQTLRLLRSPWTLQIFSEQQ